MDAAALNDFRCIPRAEFQHGDRKGCPRKTVLDEIEFWTRDFSTPPVYLSNGTGKTTIVQTTAERTFADGTLQWRFVTPTVDRTLCPWPSQITRCAPARGGFCSASLPVSRTRDHVDVLGFCINHTLGTTCKMKLV